MWGKIYEILLDMQNTFDALSTMVLFMNLQTDVAHRMANRNNNLALCAELMDKVDENMPDSVREFDVDAADQICVELRGLSFRFKSKGFIGSELKTSSAVMPQGGMYTIVGPPSEGKGMILRLMGEVILPYMPGSSCCSE